MILTFKSRFGRPQGKGIFGTDHPPYIYTIILFFYLLCHSFFPPLPPSHFLAYIIPYPPTLSYSYSFSFSLSPPTPYPLLSPPFLPSPPPPSTFSLLLLLLLLLLLHFLPSTPLPSIVFIPSPPLLSLPTPPTLRCNSMRILLALKPRRKLRRTSWRKSKQKRRKQRVWKTELPHTSSRCEYNHLITVHSD